jgi:hypothetical protein
MSHEERNRPIAAVHALPVIPGIAENNEEKIGLACAAVQRQLESPSTITAPPAIPRKRQVHQRLELTEVEPTVSPSCPVIAKVESQAKVR